MEYIQKWLFLLFIVVCWEKRNISVHSLINGTLTCPAVWKDQDNVTLTCEVLASSVNTAACPGARGQLLFNIVIGATVNQDCFIPSYLDAACNGTSYDKGCRCKERTINDTYILEYTLTVSAARHMGVSWQCAPLCEDIYNVQVPSAIHNVGNCTDVVIATTTTTATTTIAPVTTTIAPVTTTDNLTVVTTTVTKSTSSEAVTTTVTKSTTSEVTTLSDSTTTKGNVTDSVPRCPVCDSSGLLMWWLILIIVVGAIGLLASLILVIFTVWFWNPSCLTKKVWWLILLMVLACICVLGIIIVVIILLKWKEKLCFKKKEVSPPRQSPKKNGQRGDPKEGKTETNSTSQSSKTTDSEKTGNQHVASGKSLQKEHRTREETSLDLSELNSGSATSEESAPNIVTHRQLRPLPTPNLTSVERNSSVDPFRQTNPLPEISGRLKQ